MVINVFLFDILSNKKDILTAVNNVMVIKKEANKI